MTDEEWRAIPGWPYEASSLGRMRSVDRTLSDGRHAGGVVLKQTADHNGYLRVTLTDGQRRQTFGVHVLVCMAFHPRRSYRGLEVRHLSGNPWDNRAEKLTWGTKGQNRTDRERHLRRKMSQAVPRMLRHLGHK